MFKRVALFLATNLAVLLVLSIVLRLLGVDSVLDERGVGIDFQALLILSLVIGFGGSFISLAMSKWMAKRSTGARVITQPTSPAESWLVSTVERQARQAGIETPEVAIYDSPDMNAFATGARRNSALVAVSTGLLRGMPKEEVEAVLAHEVSHVANGDMVTLTLVQGVVNTFVIFLSRVVGHFVDRVLLRNESGYGIGYFASVIVAQLVLGHGRARLQQRVGLETVPHHQQDRRHDSLGRRRQTPGQGQGPETPDQKGIGVVFGDVVNLGDQPDSGTKEHGAQQVKAFSGGLVAALRALEPEAGAMGPE